MSWLRSAVHRAVGASGVRSSLGTVVHQAGQAVAGGAKLIGGTRNYKCAKLAAKRLEEAAVSCRGEERVQLLRRWLAGLQRAGSATQPLGGDPNEAEAGPLDLYVDYESEAEPMTFLHVFLYSQALESVVLSMIVEAPTEEEVALLSELFVMCLSGEKDVHSAILTSIKSLADLFSSYSDEVLAKRDELLRFARDVISGLKINADILRLDEEIMQLEQQILAIDALRGSSSKRIIASQTATESFINAVAEVRLCSRMEELVLKKKSTRPGDSLETRIHKVEKLKIYSESLASSSAKAEKRIMENRQQKEESLIFRVSKTNEVRSLEKELVAEISGLQKQRDELEAELKKVNTKLNAATLKLKKTREERDQFDEASNQIVLHLKTKEDELSRSVTSCKVEASTVAAWISFLEDTWKFQCSFEELKENKANHELDRCRICFAQLIKHHVAECKEELSTTVDHIKTLVDNFKVLNERQESAEDSDSGSTKQSNARKYLEKEYLETEKKVVSAFSLVDTMRSLFCSNEEGKTRRDDPEVKELFDSIDELRVQFESVPRPVLEIEIQEHEQRAKQPRAIKAVASPSHCTDSPIAVQLRTRFPSESDSEVGKFETECKVDEIGGWEFDDLETVPSSGFD